MKNYLLNFFFYSTIFYIFNLNISDINLKILNTIKFY
jgi:hypothetical protein